MSYHQFPLFAAVCLLFANCNSDHAASVNTAEQKTVSTAATSVKKYRGAFSNGMKGDSIFFVVSADQKTLSELTFKGYWRCSGKLERLPAAGPEGTFVVNEGKVNGSISEPPGGGSTSWRFEIDASIEGNTASGNFRMNINDLGCDSYKLLFTASAY